MREEAPFGLQAPRAAYAIEGSAPECCPALAPLGCSVGGLSQAKYRKPGLLLALTSFFLRPDPS